MSQRAEAPLVRSDRPGTVMGDLEGYSTDQLRAELARGLTLTADTLTRLGLIWQELERRGEDLSGLRHGLARTLPLIASGRLAAEAVVAFANRPTLLRGLEGVPLGQQRRLAAGESVKVIDPSNPSAVTELPLASLPAASIRVVLGDGEVREPPAQRLALRARRQRVRPDDDGAGYRFRPRYDPAAGVVHVGRMRVRLDDLLREMAAAAGPDRPLAGDVPEEYLTVQVRLAKDEWERLQAAARRAELPDWEMARKALRAWGLI